MRVIGTAGHVDHGKSTLVQALTGTHPDRLKEEREREMTIDLGFAWLTLPGGEAVGIVDVPGHIDFIENMLAGVGGIDAALFVIAADEGVMPQTREHLAILDLLKIDAGVVALDQDRSGRCRLAGIDPDRCAGSAARHGAGLRPDRSGVRPIGQRHSRSARRARSASCSSARPAPIAAGPRHAIDRVFSVAGFGTVVTGTLIDGSLRVGDEVVILPQNLPARIRGLQTHKTKIDLAVPGSRVAINLSGIELTDVQTRQCHHHAGLALAHGADRRAV